MSSWCGSARWRPPLRLLRGRLPGPPAAAQVAPLLGRPLVERTPKPQGRRGLEVGAARPREQLSQLLCRPAAVGLERAYSARLSEQGIAVAVAVERLAVHVRGGVARQ